MAVDDGIVVTRAQLDALLAEQRALRERLEALEVGARPEDRAPDRGRGPGLDRRRALIGLAGAAAGGVAATVLGATPAAAANGDSVVAGQTTAATALTTLDGRGTAGTAFRVRNDGGGGFGILADVTAGTAFRAYSTGSLTGSPTLVVENPSAGRGVLIASEGVHARLKPNARTSPSTLAGTAAGDLTTTSNGDLWYCAGGGTPPTWRKLAGTATAGALHVLPTPARVYDSRPGTQPAVGSKTPLTGNAARVLDLKANSSGVPSGATAALVTVLLVDAAAVNGNFTIWAAGAARPLANSLVWGGSAGRFTTLAVTALDAQSRCQVAASGTTNLVLDVVGYYR